MKLKENATAEKLRGGYYTPEDLAQFIVDWGMKNNQDISTVLEPSCGDGVFLQSLLSVNRKFKCRAVEVDKIESQKAKHVVECHENFEIINSDFYDFYKEHIGKEKYDLVVGNPPYIRYQYLTEEQRNIQSEILINNNMKPNKLINSWVSFVVACVQILSDVNGKIGFVIPAELLQVAYAEQLRKYLMQTLQRITIITFKELIFPNVEQEVVILLGEKDILHSNEHKIRIIEMENISGLIATQGVFREAFQNVEMDNSKWTKYFLSESENEMIKKIKKDTRFCSFNDIADVDIGITTGNNNFFCVNKETVDKYALKPIARPLIARSVSIYGIHFTYNDWLRNVNKGAKAYLLDFPDIPYEAYPDGYKNYIEFGEVNNEHTGYKCGIRDRWYRVPSIWIPNAFFLRRNHLYPKFVLNTELNALSTDTMHRIKFKPSVNPKRVIVSYYNSVALAFTEIEGRSYGGGVLEILPGELEKIILPNLHLKSLISEKQIEDLEKLIDDYIRNNNDIINLVETIDKKVLIELLKIPEETVLQFRSIWLTLRNRRLSRGKNKS